MSRKCIYCGEELPSRRRKFCNAECKEEYYAVNGTPRKCPVCGKRFIGNKRRRKYCSDECENVAKKRKENSAFKNEQLCWRCKKACKGCSWSRDFKPVKGWTALPSKNYPDGYRIISCPEFESD